MAVLTILVVAMVFCGLIMFALSGPKDDDPDGV